MCVLLRAAARSFASRGADTSGEPRCAAVCAPLSGGAFVRKLWGRHLGQAAVPQCLLLRAARRSQAVGPKRPARGAETERPRAAETRAASRECVPMSAAFTLPPSTSPQTSRNARMSSVERTHEGRGLTVWQLHVLESPFPSAVFGRERGRDKLLFLPLF